MTEEPPENPEPGPEPPADAGDPAEGGGIAAEVSRRVSSILDAVEGEAARLREDTREEARRYLDYSRRRADGLVAERQRRISELSDDIVSKAEAVVGRLDDAAPVREGFENLVRALGDAAERLSREAERTRPDWEPPAFHDETVAEHEPPAATAPPPPPRVPGAAAPGAGASEPPAPDYQVPAEPGSDPSGQLSPAPFQTPSGAPHPPPAPAPGGPELPGPPPEQPDPARAPEQPPAPAPQASPAAPAAGGQQVDDAKLVAIQMAASGRTRQEVRDHLHRAMAVTDTRQLLDEIFGAGSAEDARVPWTAFPR